MKLQLLDNSGRVVGEYDLRDDSEGCWNPESPEELRALASEISSTFSIYKNDTIKPQTFQDLMSQVPGSEMGEDLDGQLVIYTGKMEGPNGTLLDFAEEMKKQGK